MKRGTEVKSRMDNYPNILLRSKNWNVPIYRSAQQCGHAWNHDKEFTPKCSFGRTPSSIGVRCLSQFLQYLLVTVHLVAVHLKSIRSSETLLYISIGSERAHPHCGHWVWSASISTSIFGSGLRCDDLFLVFLRILQFLDIP